MLALWARFRGAGSRTVIEIYAAPVQTPSFDTERRAILLLVKPDQQRPAFLDRGRTQVAGGSEHLFEAGLHVDVGLAFVIRVHLSPLGDDDTRHLGQQGQCVGAAELCPCAHGLANVHVVFGKEPLRPGAGRSPRTVIVPVDVLSHG